MLPVGTNASAGAGVGDSALVGEAVTAALTVADAVALGGAKGVEAGLAGVPVQPDSPTTAMHPTTSMRKPGDSGSTTPGHAVLAAMPELLAFTTALYSFRRPGRSAGISDRGLGLGHIVDLR
jgi:hypothetical protein